MQILRTDDAMIVKLLFVFVKEKNDYVYAHAAIQIFAFYFHSDTNVNPCLKFCTFSLSEKQTFSHTRVGRHHAST